MQLRESDVDDVEKEVLANKESGLASLQFEGATVGALLELACRAWEWEERGTGAAIQLARQWAKQSHVFGGAWSALRRGQPIAPPPPFAEPKFEMFLLVPTDEHELGWQYHTERFARSLKRSGFSKGLADGLAAAYREMGDNVFDHSGPDEKHPARALAAYRVGERQMAFAVADVGRGVLASLRSKPEWSHLAEAREALNLAVQERATRRRDHAQGSGFRQVHRAIADMYGTLRFRSGDATLTLQGLDETSRHATHRDSPMGAGFQLSVTCAFEPGQAELYVL